MSQSLQDFQNQRLEYEKFALDESYKEKNPILLCSDWMKEAVANGAEKEPYAMHLCTFGKDEFPRARVVLLRELEQDGGLIFYSNYRSRKGEEIEHHNKISVSFFWPSMERQIHIQGTCSEVSPEMSDAYFAQRPKASQLGAWASNQSRKISSHEELQKQYAAIEQRFQGVIPRPTHWGGYRIEPSSFEFWQGRPSRMHQRLVFEKLSNETYSAFWVQP